MTNAVSDELAMKIVNGGFLHCRDFHDYSCEYNSLVKFITAYKTSLIFYVPVHLVPVMLFKYKLFLKKPFEVIIKYIKDVARSTCFVAAYIAGFEYLRYVFISLNFINLTGRFNSKVISFSAFLAGLLLFIEAPWRRSEIVIFFLSRILPSVWKFLVKWKYVRSIPYGEVIVLAIAMSVLMYSYHSQPDSIKNTYYKMFNFFLGEN